MPMRDNTRFNRTELLRRFQEEINHRYLPLEAYYNPVNGLLGFKSDTGDVKYYIETMLPDAFGIPAQFTLIDDAGGEVNVGSIYDTISALNERLGIKASPPPQFEFVCDQTMTPGDWGKFSYGGNEFFVEFVSGENDYEGNGSFGTFVTSTEGIGVASFNDLDAMTTEGATDRTQVSVASAETPVIARSGTGKVLARKVSELARDRSKCPKCGADLDTGGECPACGKDAIAIKSSAQVFNTQPLKRHLKECAFAYRPYKRVIKITKLSAAEVFARKHWLRKTKAHRKVMATRYYRTHKRVIAQKVAKRAKLHIHLKPHKPGYTYDYKQ